MEHYKIIRIINDSTEPKFVKKKQIEVNELSNEQYSSYKSTRFKSLMLGSVFCDHSDAYIADSTSNVKSFIIKK